MNTQAQIEKQLNDEVNDFYNKVYDGKIDIPANFIEVFKKSVMALAPQFHKVNANKLNVIAHKEFSELTMSDLKDAITLIFNTPFYKKYTDFDEAMQSHLRIQKFVLCYNNIVEDFEKKLSMKKATLIDLTRPNGNGLRLAN